MTLRIERVVPTPPPEIRMSFAVGDGWAIVAALAEYAERHPGAAQVQEWKRWASELDAVLRREQP